MQKLKIQKLSLEDVIMMLIDLFLLKNFLKYQEETMKNQLLKEKNLFNQQLNKGGRSMKELKENKITSKLNGKENLKLKDMKGKDVQKSKSRLKKSKDKISKNKLKKKNGREKAEFKRQKKRWKDLNLKDQDKSINGELIKIEKLKEFKELKNLKELKLSLNLLGIDQFLFTKLIIKV